MMQATRHDVRRFYPLFFVAGVAGLFCVLCFVAFWETRRRHAAEERLQAVKVREQLEASRRGDATGIPLERRKKIYAARVAAQDRARWQALRLFSPDSDQALATEYEDLAIPLYEDELIHFEGITEKSLRTIEIEALVGKWPFDEYPSCDLVEAAKPLRLQVWIEWDKPVYHRRSCPLTSGDKIFNVRTLEEFMAKHGRDESYQPCSRCRP
jgi:hypothetical protein